MSRPTINGYDYRTHEPRALTRGEWAQTISGLIADGHRRRVEDGETFLHAPGGRIVLEVYSNVAPAKVEEQS